MRPETGILSWLHIGDLHIDKPDGQNLSDLRWIVALANDLPPNSFDFVLLPGDNAENGTAAQFKLVRDALAPLRLPLHILPGDHDYQPTNLDAFYSVLGARTLPYATTINGHRCLFLDMVSAGTGGPNSRLDTRQLDWIERELARDDPAVVFMHAYPADLQQGAGRLIHLLAKRKMRCVDMGHTHYNELANDGVTIFMATRSTGQIEEGPPGFSITVVDDGRVSWRFKILKSAWPCVVVTQRADQRLVTSSHRVDYPALIGSKDVSNALLMRAKVVGDAPIETVEVSVDHGEWLAVMTPVPGEPTLWQTLLLAPPCNIRVRVTDANGRQDQDEVEPATFERVPPRRFGEGSDQNRIGAWPAKETLDTRLGPNRNGRSW